MARQDNPFGILGEDDEGADVSGLLAKVEAKMSAMTMATVQTKQTKQKTVPSKISAPSESVREERGRGRGGRGRGSDSGGFGNVGGDYSEQPEIIIDRGYNGESVGDRRGRGSRGGMGRGRGRSFTGFNDRNNQDFGNPLEGVEGGSEYNEKGNYGERRPFRHDNRNLGEEYQGRDGEQRENYGFQGYGADRENRGFRGYGDDLEKRERRDGEGQERNHGGDGEIRGFRAREGRGRGYGGRGRRGGYDGGRGGARFEPIDGFNSSESKKTNEDEKDLPVNNRNNGDGGSGWGHGDDLEKRELRDGDGHEISHGGDGEIHGFRAREGRGRGYGGRGRRGGYDGGRGGSRFEPSDEFNSSEIKNTCEDEKDLPVNTKNNAQGGFGWDDPIVIEEPKDVQPEKPIPLPIVSEDPPKVLEEDNEMTLAEYEKVLQEKRKALESLKATARRVDFDKDLEGMQIIERKKEDGLTKMKSDNDKGKKKEAIERDEKSRKPQSIYEFLKPADGERYRGPTASRGRGGGGGRGRGRAGYTSDYSRQAAAAPSLEDPAHFPILGPTAKA